MIKEKLWTKNFIALVMSNALLFGGFHILLPTLPIYAVSLGITGSDLGIITGIFGFSAIFIRFFTDLWVKKFGKKNCLCIGLIISFACTLSYVFFNSINELILARIFHGFGFGLTTTFSAALAADIIPAVRRGEGIGYFGLGSTVAMAMAPAVGVWILNASGAWLMFLSSATATILAFLSVKICNVEKEVIKETSAAKRSLKNKLFERGTEIPAILTMFFGIGYGSVNTFIAMMAQEAHIESAGLFFIVGTFCVFVSRPFGGRIFDKKGAGWVILPGGLFFIGALILILNTKTLTMLLLASVLYGFGGGLLLPALMTWMLNLVSQDRKSGASATFYNMLDVGTSAGIIFFGTIADKIGYVKMYRYPLTAMVIFLIIFVLQSLFKSRNIKQPKEISE